MVLYHFVSFRVSFSGIPCILLVCYLQYHVNNWMSINETNLFLPSTLIWFYGARRPLPFALTRVSFYERELVYIVNRLM